MDRLTGNTEHEPIQEVDDTRMLTKLVVILCQEFLDCRLHHGRVSSGDTLQLAENTISRRLAAIHEPDEWHALRQQQLDLSFVRLGIQCGPGRWRSNRMNQ